MIWEENLRLIGEQHIEDINGLHSFADLTKELDLNMVMGNF